MKLKREVWRKHDGTMVWANSTTDPCFLVYNIGEDISDDVLLEHGLIRPKEEPTKAAPPTANKMSGSAANKGA